MRDKRAASQQVIRKSTTSSLAEIAATVLPQPTTPAVAARRESWQRIERDKIAGALFSIVAMRAPELKTRIGRRLTPMIVGIPPLLALQDLGQSASAVLFVGDGSPAPVRP
jgi:hypothetical protein